MFKAKYRDAVLVYKFCHLNKIKVSLLHEEANEIKNIDFIWCYATWLKDGIYAIRNIVVEILMHNRNIYSSESIFLFAGNSIFRFNYKNDALDNLES